MYIEFETDLKPTSTQEILEINYESLKDFEETQRLLRHLPVRWTIKRPISKSKTIKVIIPKKR